MVKMQVLMRMITTIHGWRIWLKACQAFVQQLGSVSSDSLAKADTQIVVIGCGEWNPISAYVGAYLAVSYCT